MELTMNLIAMVRMNLRFIGGAGDSSSHIVEGLCTALNLFDDLDSLRSKSNLNPTQNENQSLSSSFPSNLNVNKYCILICNSTPYLEPAYENQNYFGYTIEQLLNLMVEREINFSVFSPRKINFLYKMFENAGGRLLNALQRNFARDRRHLVLLNGFSLHEKAISPLSQPSSTEQDKSGHQSLVGTKRPHSPTNMPGSNMMLNQNAQMVVRNQITTGVGSPSMNQWMSPNGAGTGVSSPSQMFRNGNVRPLLSQSNNVNNGLMNSNQNLSGLVPQNVNSNLISSPINQLQQQQQQQQSNNSNIPNPQMPRSSASVAPSIRAQQQQLNNIQAPSPSQPQPSPHGIRIVSSPINQQQSIPSPLPSANQQFNSQQHQQQMNQMTQSNQALGPMSQPTNMPMQNVNQNQRTKIWSGIIEYIDKTNPQGRVTYGMECFITYQPNNNEPELKAENWPDKLPLYTVPKNLMNRLSPIFKNNSYQISSNNVVNSSNSMIQTTSTPLNVLTSNVMTSNVSIAQTKNSQTIDAMGAVTTTTSALMQNQQRQPQFSVNNANNSQMRSFQVDPNGNMINVNPANNTSSIHQQQQQQNPGVRQHLQQQLQQKQHIQLQQNQSMSPMNIVNNNSNLNGNNQTQLRHLLQQQQQRSMGQRPSLQMQTQQNVAQQQQIRSQHSINVGQHQNIGGNDFLMNN
ncbi:hypothetical protein QR98_0048630 [Sarcoptes scabiei]|uniref:Mediator of RNA polymerase II transcription subunit 25 n=1 Tax=Sarcoptes scabiei TaxID=52283 RepID=A0A132A5Z8_SARSC|nr:hypothetical protein QR98_0048630 [Sarcoptes scabiei]